MNKQFFLKSLLTQLLVFCSAVGWAQTFTVDGINYSIISPSERTVEVIQGNYSELTTEVIIPSTVNYDGYDYSVVRIGTSAFYCCGSLKSITLPESVTQIGGYTFYDCSNLESIVIPAGVTQIGAYAFAFCSNLESIDIPESVTQIGACAFYCCGFTSITLPEGLTEIGDAAFEGCFSLYKITSKILEPFAVQAFDCFDTAVFIVPKGTRSAYKNVGGWNFKRIFEEGEKVYDEFVTDEQGVCYTLNYDSEYYYSVTGRSEDLGANIVIPADIDGCPVKSIGAYAFLECSSLESIVIPAGVTSIGGMLSLVAQV